MKIESLREVKAKLSKIVKELPSEKSVVITKNGRPCAVLFPVTEETDLESMLLAQRKDFWQLLDRAHNLIQIEGAIIEHGELLEEYPDDPRGESCLVLGFVGSRPLHAVLGWAIMKDEPQRMLRLITVYTPTAPKWTDPRTRGGRS